MHSSVAIDWAATGAMLQGIGSVIGGVAVIIAAFIGGNTFKSWRQQKLAERRIDQAERILSATYKVRSALLYVRNPRMLTPEIMNATEILKRDGVWGRLVGEQEQRNHSQVQVYYNRIECTKNDQLELQECLPIARALFGEELEKAMVTLNHQFWIVQLNADARLEDKNGLDLALKKQIDSVLLPDSSSEFDLTTVEQVKIIENILVPVLKLEN